MSNETEKTQIQIVCRACGETEIYDINDQNKQAIKHNLCRKCKDRFGPLFENRPPTIHKPDLTGMIAINDCIKGRLYKIRARNFQLGVYDGQGGFIGRRNKFGQWYLFTEYHYDTGAPHGTAMPMEDTGIDLPEGIEAKENGNPKLAAFLIEHAT